MTMKSTDWWNLRQHKSQVNSYSIFPNSCSLSRKKRAEISFRSRLSGKREKKQFRKHTRWRNFRGWHTSFSMKIPGQRRALLRRHVQTRIWLIYGYSSLFTLYAAYAAQTSSVFQNHCFMDRAKKYRNRSCQEIQGILAYTQEKYSCKWTSNHMCLGKQIDLGLFQM